MTTYIILFFGGKRRAISEFDYPAPEFKKSFLQDGFINAFFAAAVDDGFRASEEDLRKCRIIGVDEILDLSFALKIEHRSKIQMI